LAKDIIKYGIILGIVCAVAGVGLATVYAQTKVVIDIRKEADFQNMLSQVVPGADSFDKVEADGKQYYVGLADQKTVGYAVQVSTGGYGGAIEIMIGTDPSLKVNKIVIMSQRETPGLGSKIQSPEFTSLFTGKTPQDPIAVGQDIEVITGATISSRAVAGGVKKALSDLEAALGGASKSVDLSSVPDGTYVGTGQGFNAKISVSVEMKAGRIEKVSVTQHSESEGVSDPAIEGVPRAIVEKQAIFVDEVSGATWSSRGIMEAVQDALKEFIKD